MALAGLLTAAQAQRPDRSADQPPARFTPGSIRAMPGYSGAATPVSQPAGKQDPFSARPAGAATSDDIPLATTVFAQPGSQGVQQAAGTQQVQPPSFPASPAAVADDRYAPRQLDAGPSQIQELRGADGQSALLQGSTGEAVTGAGKPGGKHLEGLQTPSITLEKVMPPEVQVNRPATFEIRLRNIGAVVAQQVELLDEIPHGARLISTNPRAQRGTRGELIWPIGTLKPGQEVTVRCELMPTAEGELGSVASVRFAAEASARTVSTRPDLRMEVLLPQEVMIGQEAMVKIRVSNPGTGVATGVVLSEHVPALVEHPAGEELEYEIGQLQPKESRELTLKLRAVKPGTAVNLLTVRGDGQLLAEDKSALTVLAPALDVALEGPRRRFLDRQATYTLSISNPGTASARGVELAATLPAGLKFVEANNSGQFDPATRKVHWLLDELPPNQKGTVTLTAMPIEAGEQVIRIASTAELGLNVEKQEAVLVEGVAAVMFQVADLADPVEIGGETTYEVKVVNQGSKAAGNVQLVAQLPTGVKALSAEGPTRYDLVGQEVRFQELPRLAPKAETTYRIRVQCTAPGDMRMRAQLTTDDIRTPITKEESTRVFADQ
jgi:uncharacterized repeat protein (TIGR01451 family)